MSGNAAGRALRPGIISDSRKSPKNQVKSPSCGSRATTTRQPLHGSRVLVRVIPCPREPFTSPLAQQQPSALAAVRQLSSPPRLLLRRWNPAAPAAATMREVISIHIGQAGECDRSAGCLGLRVSQHAAFDPM